MELSPFEIIDAIVILDELNARIALDDDAIRGYLAPGNAQGLRDAMVALIEPCGYLYDPDDAHAAAALTIAADAYRRILRIHLNTRAEP